MNNPGMMKDTAGKKREKKDCSHFLMIADTIFSPIYPVIAEQIIKNTGICEGKALDAGCGPGHLSMALSAASRLTINALDISPEMIQICSDRVCEKNLAGRVIPIHGDVGSIPFDDATFDLIVSRGSWFFWDDLSQGLKELYRVLKPGGKTYIGGGFGTASLKHQIVTAMTERDPGFEDEMKERMASRSPEIIASALEKAGMAHYSIINDGSGFWLQMEKP